MVLLIKIIFASDVSQAPKFLHQNESFCWFWAGPGYNYNCEAYYQKDHDPHKLHILVQAEVLQSSFSGPL